MPDKAEPVNGTGRAEQPIWPGLTLEAVLYAVLLAGAAFIRFFDLGRWPLMAEEARQALAAWRVLHGQPAGTSVAPLLFNGALAGFFAFGASDAVARLLPALLGTALVLTPLALRRRLGRWGALAATFILAFSPTLVYYSRTLAGPVPALAGLAAVLWALDLAGRRQTARAQFLGGLGLALSLTSSPWTYTFFLAALLFAGMARFAYRRGRPWLGWAASEDALRPVLRDGRAWAGLAVVVAPLATALFLNIGGLQAMLDLFGTWLGRLAPGSSGRSWLYPLGILAYYELGVLLLGLAGAVVAVRRHALLARFLAVWAVLAIALATLSGARDGEPVAMAVLPLALLSGLALSVTVPRLKRPQWTWVGVAAFVFVALLGFGWLNVAGYAGGYTDALRGNQGVALALAVASPLFLAGALVAFYTWVGRTETTWAASIVGLALLGALVLRGSVALNLAHARDAREPLVVAPSALGLKDMVAFLEDWSVRTALDQHALTIGVQEDLGPLVPWYLRDFQGARSIRRPGDATAFDALVLPAGDGAARPAGYVATRYVLQTVSDAPLGSGRNALAWWLVGTGGGAVRQEAINLWVKP